MVTRRTKVEGFDVNSILQLPDGLVVAGNGMGQILVSGSSGGDDDDDECVPATLMHHQYYHMCLLSQSLHSTVVYISVMLGMLYHSGIGVVW